MNVFYLDLNPTVSAGWLVDKHVLKMVLEYTQLLANAFHMPGATAPPKTRAGTTYAKSHWDHPCAVWVRQDFKHWHWVKMGAFELCSQYQTRFPNALLKQHACYDALAHMEGAGVTEWMPRKNWVDPPQCMPVEFQIRGNTVGAYRAYYKTGKKHLHQWTGVKPPEWIVPKKKSIRELAADLIDQAELIIPHPDRFRPADLTDEEWGEVTRVAFDVINGRME